MAKICNNIKKQNELKIVALSIACVMNIMKKHCKTKFETKIKAKIM
jgi:hypothetical protein